jgi:hypothetical protein
MAVVTTMPTTTASFRENPSSRPLEAAQGRSSSPVETGPSKAGILARRAVNLAIRYRIELAPAAATSTATGLGWAQHLAGISTGGATAYTCLAILAAGLGWAGLTRSHEKLMLAGAGLTAAFADIATATGAGPGTVSLTATAITTGLAYAAWTPWLINHRKDQKAIPGKAHATANATANVQVQMGKEQTAINATATSTSDSQQQALVPSGPFWDASIPYADDTSRDIADPIGIGWDEYGRRVTLPLLYRHTLIAGAPDWGKSGILNLIIKKLIRKDHVELYGIDLKPGTPELGPWRPLFKKIASTPEEARNLLNEILALGERRGAQLEQLSLANLRAGRAPVRKWVPGEHGTAVYVITDELAELVRQDEQLRKEEEAYRKLDKENVLPPEPAVTARFESGLAVLRFLAIQYIGATQQPSARVFGGSTDARGNYGNRLSTRAGEAGHADFVFGRGCRSNGFTPEKLTRPGEFYLQNSEMPQTEPPRCRAEYVTDLDIAADVAHLYQAMPPQPIGQFAPQGTSRLSVVKKPLSDLPTYPDGETMSRSEWPDLYWVFLRLCEEQGHATKEDLVDHGPFDSRDTVRRALDVWVEHGVLVRKAGRAEQFYLPDDAS